MCPCGVKQDGAGSHRIGTVTERGPLSGGFGFESVAPDPFDVIAVGLKFVVHVSKGE